MLVTLCGSLALLAWLLTAALLLAWLLAWLLTRRLILLAGLVLVRHGISFHGNTRPTARSSGSFLTKKKCGSPCRNYVSLTYSGLRFLIDVLPRQRLRRIEPRLLRRDTARKCLEFREHHTNTQPPPNEQAGTRVSKQPLTTRIIDSVLNKQGNFRCRMQTRTTRTRN
jgi:hypothetical protein